MEDDNCFGHYPFQLYVESKNGGIELNALALSGDVFSCYKRVQHYIRKDAKLLFLSVDFPASGDIEHDFVCVISVINGEVSAFALPYDSHTGKRFDVIHKSDHLSGILSQFRSVVFQ